jgi:hypothetical protein
MTPGATRLILRRAGAVHVERAVDPMDQVAARRLGADDVDVDVGRAVDGPRDRGAEPFQ